VHRLEGKKQGKPLLLGHKLDLKLQEQIVAMWERGAPIGSSTVIGIGMEFLMRYKKPNKENDEPELTLSKDWAVAVLQRMDFTKRRANSKSKVLPANFGVIKEQFLLDIRGLVVMEDIPKETWL